MKSIKLTNEEKIYLFSMILLSIFVAFIFANYIITIINFIIENYISAFIQVCYPDYKIGIDDLQ
jgi:hypothetical protein